MRAPLDTSQKVTDTASQNVEGGGGRMRAALREARGDKTQEWVGSEVGLRRTTIAMYELGKRTPNLTTAGRLARVLGRPVQELFPELLAPSCDVSGSDGRTESVRSGGDDDAQACAPTTQEHNAQASLREPASAGAAMR